MIIRKLRLDKGWGIGVLMHGLTVFERFSFFGAEWERAGGKAVAQIAQGFTTPPSKPTGRAGPHVYSCCIPINSL